MLRCFHPEKYMNGIEERAGCQATSVKTGRCRWKYFILLTSEERVVQSQSKEALGKKKSIFALGYNRGFKCDIYKGFYCLKRPFKPLCNYLLSFIKACVFCTVSNNGI